MDGLAFDRQLGMRQLTIENPYVAAPVHVYVCEIGEELILFDTGPPTQAAQAQLRSQVDLERVRYVFLTHGHADHHGLATFVTNFGAELILSRKDAWRFQQAAQGMRQLGNILTELGFPEAEARAVTAAAGRSNQLTSAPANFRQLEEVPGLLEELGISYLYCPWHCQSDIVYMLGDYAVSGDAILRGVFPTPFIDTDFNTGDGCRFSNYLAFCQSISRFKEIETRTFLPGHRDYLADVDSWVRYAVTKLVKRASKVVPAFLDGRNVYQTISAHLGQTVRDPFKAYAKASEVVFLYDFLTAPEALIGSLQQVGLSSEFEQLLAEVLPV